MTLTEALALKPGDKVYRQMGWDGQRVTSQEPFTVTRITKHTLWLEGDWRTWDRSVGLPLRSLPLSRWSVVSYLQEDSNV